MINMIFDAQLLIVQESPYSIYSPWFVRLADNARFTLEVVAINGSPEIKLEVIDRVDDGSGIPTALGGNIALSATGRTTAEWTGLKALVRFRFTITPNAGGTEWILFRVPSPIWFSDVKV